MGEAPSEKVNILLTIVRHGQTHENKSKTIQGQKDTKLTELGIDQAEQLGRYFSNEKFDMVYASDLSRAHETCKIVAGPRYQIHTSQLLRERKFGVIEGQPMDKLKACAREAGFSADNFTQYIPEGGESMQDVQNRVEKFCTEILVKQAKDGQHILIVTHGGVVREFLKLFASKYSCPIATHEMKITPNTGFNKFDIIGLPSNGKILGVKIVCLHRVDHLTGDNKNEALHEEQLNDATGGKKPKEEEEVAV